MKKKILVGILFTFMSIMLIGCGEEFVKNAAGIDGDGKDDATTGAETIVSGPAIKIESYDADKLVKLPNYDNMKINTNVTDKDVEEEKQNLLKANPIKETIMEGQTKNGDTINIDFHGTVDGKDFEGGSASNIEITIGNNQVIGDFDKQVVGISVGETRTINCAIPSDDPDKELAGKTVKFDVKVNSIIKITPATFNDEFVKNTTTYASVKEYEKNRKNDLKNERESNAPQELLQKIIDTSQVNEIPQTLIDAERGTLLSEVQATLNEKKMTFKKYLEENLQTETQFNMQLELNAEEMAKTMLVTEAILKKEGQSATASELNDYIEYIAQSNGQTVDQLEKNYNNYYAQSMDFRTYMKQSMEYADVLNVLKETRENKKKGE